MEDVGFIHHVIPLRVLEPPIRYVAYVWLVNWVVTDSLGTSKSEETQATRFMGERVDPAFRRFPEPHPAIT